MRAALLTLALLTPTAGAADLLIDFAPGGPKVVRVEVTLDGKPTGPLWDAAVDDLFKFFDRNGDGKLDKTERERLVTPSAPRRRPNTAPDERPAGDFEFLGKLAFDAKAETVDRAALAAALKAAGFGPLTITTQTGRADNPALTAALFKHLDANGDGKLSTAELKNAREALAHLDVNEDELLTVPEILGRAVSTQQRQVVRDDRAGNDALAAPDWLVLQGDEASAVAALVKRGVPKPGGKMNADEVTAWLHRPPDLTITAALSRKPGESRVTPSNDRLTPDGRQVTLIEGAAPARREALAEVFQSAAGGTDPLAGTTGGWAGAVRSSAFATAYEKFAACRATLEVTDRGRSLFDWLDTDGNGTFSPRELATAATRFSSFPIPPAGVPRQVVYRVYYPSLVGNDTTNGDRTLAITRPLTTTYTRPLDGPTNMTPPTWFAKMDRNGDGDVSLREFLGPLELFRRLDADGDGLISVAEALKR